MHALCSAAAQQAAPFHFKGAGLAETGSAPLRAWPVQLVTGQPLSQR